MPFQSYVYFSVSFKFRLFVFWGDFFLVCVSPQGQKVLEQYKLVLEPIFCNWKCLAFYSLNWAELSQVLYLSLMMLHARSSHICLELHRNVCFFVFKLGSVYSTGNKLFSDPFWWMRLFWLYPFWWMGPFRL